MKKQLLALVGLGLLLATASASAQTVLLKANIPFNFIVNKAELPAGEYTTEESWFLWHGHAHPEPGQPDGQDGFAERLRIVKGADD